MGNEHLSPLFNHEGKNVDPPILSIFDDATQHPRAN
jgi:hypothetical protein